MSDAKGIVILLHGITKTSRMMAPLEAALLAAGFLVRNMDYPSTKYSIKSLTQNIYQRIKPDFLSDQPVHFVGHSMGAMIARMIIHDCRPNCLGRVVMLAPPNQGSEVAAFMQGFKFYRKWYGPAGLEIGSNAQGIHHQLPAVDYPCGIIAGDRSIDPWFSWFLYHSPNDGKVSVENTQLDGMTDHIVLPLPHSRLPKDPGVIRCVKKFLMTGAFA